MEYILRFIGIWLFLLVCLIASSNAEVAAPVCAHDNHLRPLQGASLTGILPKLNYEQCWQNFSDNFNLIAIEVNHHMGNDSDADTDSIGSKRVRACACKENLGAMDQMPRQLFATDKFKKIYRDITIKKTSEMYQRRFFSTLMGMLQMDNTLKRGGFNDYALAKVSNCNLNYIFSKLEERKKGTSGCNTSFFDQQIKSIFGTASLTSAKEKLQRSVVSLMDNSLSREERDAGMCIPLRGHLQMNSPALATRGSFIMQEGMDSDVYQIRNGSSFRRLAGMLATSGRQSLNRGDSSADLSVPDRAELTQGRTYMDALQYDPFIALVGDNAELFSAYQSAYNCRAPASDCQNLGGLAMSPTTLLPFLQEQNKQCGALYSEDITNFLCGQNVPQFSWNTVQAEIVPEIEKEFGEFKNVALTHYMQDEYCNATISETFTQLTAAGQTLATAVQTESMRLRREVRRRELGKEEKRQALATISRQEDAQMSEIRQSHSESVTEKHAALDLDDEGLLTFKAKNVFSRDLESQLKPDLTPQSNDLMAIYQQRGSSNYKNLNQSVCGYLSECQTTPVPEQCRQSAWVRAQMERGMGELLTDAPALARYLAFVNDLNNPAHARAIVEELRSGEYHLLATVLEGTTLTEEQRQKLYDLTLMKYHADSLTPAADGTVSALATFDEDPRDEAGSRSLFADYVSFGTVEAHDQLEAFEKTNLEGNPQLIFGNGVSGLTGGAPLPPLPYERRPPPPIAYPVHPVDPPAGVADNPPSGSLHVGARSSGASAGAVPMGSLYERGGFSFPVVGESNADAVVVAELPPVRPNNSSESDLERQRREYEKMLADYDRMIADMEKEKEDLRQEIANPQGRGTGGQTQVAQIPQQVPTPVGPSNDITGGGGGENVTNNGIANARVASNPPVTSAPNSAGRGGGQSGRSISGKKSGRAPASAGGGIGASAPGSIGGGESDWENLESDDAEDMESELNKRPGIPGLRPPEQHLKYEYQTVLPGMVLESVSLPELVSLLRLEGMHFSLLIQSAAGLMYLDVYGPNPEKHSWKELLEKDSVIRRLKLKHAVEEVRLKDKKAEEQLWQLAGKTSKIYTYQIKERWQLKTVRKNLIPADKLHKLLQELKQAKSK